MQKKIIAIALHPGGVNAISPVIRRLTEEGKLDVVVIACQYSEDIFSKNAVSYKGINDYGLSDVSVESMEKLLQQESPDLVLTGTSAQNDDDKDVIEQTVTLAASLNSINSLAVLDFWGHYSERFSDIFTDERFKFLPDKIAILDELAKNTMLREGFPENRLVVTGNPHFDGFSELKEKYKGKKDQLRRQLQISLGKYILMYASDVTSDIEKHGWSFYDTDCVEIICQGIKDAGKTDATKLILKKHPRESEGNFSRLAEIAAASGIDAEKNYDDIRLVALASDLVAAPVSTVLLETLLMGNAAVSLQPGNTRGYVFVLGQLGVIPCAYDRESGVELIKDVITDNSFMEPYREKRGQLGIDGRATERVVDLIYDMI